MAIKYLNNNVNIINYEDKDVKKVILDSDIVWCKPFIYTTGTLPTGVASLTCTRYSNDEPSASTGTIANGGTIYYGDTLYWSATAATGYNNPTVTYDGSTAEKRYTVAGNINGVTASGVQAGSIKTYTITLNSTYGHWENASGTTITSIANVAYGTATSKSSNKLTVGSNVYTFVVNSDTAQYSYAFSSISGNPATVTSNVTITGTATRTLRTYAITFSNGTYGSWSKSSITAYYGDLVSRSGDTVTVYKWDATTTARDSSTYTLSSSTAQYTYTNSYSAITSPVSGTQTISSTDTRTLNKYTITLSSTHGYWTNSSSTTITSIPNVNYGTAISKTGTTLTVGSNTYTFNKNADTAQYSYSNPTIGDVPATLTGNVTISGTATQTLRSYTVTFTNPTYGAWGSTSKTAYYGDTLSVSSYTVTCKQGSTTRWTNTCTANAQTDQYTYALTGTVSAPSTVDGNETVSGPSSTRTERSYNVTFTNGTYGTWNSTTAISAKYSDTISLSGNVVTVGSTSRTYTLPSDTAQYTYTTTINNASGTVGTGKAITATDVRSTVQYTITWHYRTAYNAWSDVQTVYYYGDTPGTTTPVSGTVPVPEDKYDSGENYRFIYSGWDSLSTVTANRTITAQYEHEMNLTITEADCDNVLLDGVSISCPYEDWINIDDTSSLPTIEWIASTNTNFKMSFSNSDLASPDQNYSENVIASKYNYYKSADYYYPKVNLTVNTNSTAKVSSTTTGGTILSTGTYYILENSYINLTTDTPPSNTRYSFSNTSSDVTSKSDKITSAITINYPIYIWYYVQINATNSTAHKGESTGTTITSGSSAWYISGQKITWTPSTNYSFSAGTSQTNTSATISSASALSKSPTNYKLASCSASYCSAKVGSATGSAVSTSTYYASGSKIYWVADSNHSFAGSAVSDTRSGTTSITAGGTPSMTPGYTKCTISGTNCSANKTTGSLLGNGNDSVTQVTITWTANTGYHFNDDQTKTTDTATVTASTTNYSKTANINVYTITWRYRVQNSTSYTTTTQNYNYNATPSRTAPTSPIYDTSAHTSNKYTFTQWDSLAKVTANRTITAQYSRQVYIVINYPNKDKFRFAYARYYESDGITLHDLTTGWYNYDTRTVSWYWYTGSYYQGISNYGQSIKNMSSQLFSTPGTYKQLIGYMTTTTDEGKIDANKRSWRLYYGGDVTSSGSDTGWPLAGVTVKLQRYQSGSWSDITSGTTDAYGYVALTAPASTTNYQYRLIYAGAIFQGTDADGDSAAVRMESLEGYPFWVGPKYS